MAKMFTDKILADIKELIHSTTGFEVGSEQFNAAEKRTITQFKKSDTMYFLTTKEIDRSIASMSEKFRFHGYSPHADRLKAAHDKYINENLTKGELNSRLNTVKFLLCMSNCPTTFFWKHPERFVFLYEDKEEEEIVDWAAYLNEGIERWSPVKNDSFDFSDGEDRGGPEVDTQRTTTYSSNTTIMPKSENKEYNFRECRSLLQNTIQDSWWFKGGVLMNPSSDWFQANVGILWEQHLKDQVHGLVQIETATVISEYKVLREILWQMWKPHSSVVFQFQGDTLVPRSNVTISSVRAVAFEGLMKTFIPYIEQLESFRQFQKSLSSSVPSTYWSYANSLQKIIDPVLQQLLQIEEEIRRQETTFTLLKLMGEFEIIFQPINILHCVHQEAVIDFTSNSHLICSLTLLTRLRRRLRFSLSKLEQDICLSLYLESLYYYFATIQGWLIKNDFHNPHEEFVIIKNAEEFKTQEDVSTFSDKDGVILLMCGLNQIGENNNLLLLLRKFDLVTKIPETIYEEFIRRILEELCNFYAVNLINNNCKDEVITNDEMVAHSDTVDVTDGFLMAAFEGFNVKPSVKPSDSLSLYEQIRQITANVYPLRQLPERVFVDILKERFTISGLMVKNILIEDYSLDKQFEFLSHVFLFHEDLIFPLYRKVFAQMNSPNGNWGNSVHLTALLQDTIMDIYPNFYENCSIQIKDYWRQCRDSLEACTLINVEYIIKWPLNIVITQAHLSMYGDIFQFLLKIKWALYTTNHLSYADLILKGGDGKGKEKKFHSHFQNTVKRLKCLRFGLINALNSVQHYVFGFVFNKCRMQFELNFEKANDLKSVTRAHEVFIKDVHGYVMEIRDCQRNGENGFNAVMTATRLLKVMWKKKEHATFTNLTNCHDTCRRAYGTISTIVNPVCVFD